MTHRSTALAELREKDRTRQRRRRDRMKQLGIPQPHQIDNACSEALSFALAMSAADKHGIRSQSQVQHVPFSLVFKTALDILTKRWSFNPENAATALKARLSKRPEHFDPYWTPHYPWREPKAWADMSTSESASTPVTPSGHVQDGAA